MDDRERKERGNKEKKEDKLLFFTMWVLIL